MPASARGGHIVKRLIVVVSKSRLALQQHYPALALAADLTMLDWGLSM